MFENEKLHILNTFKGYDTKKEKIKQFIFFRKEKFTRESNKIKSKYNYLILRLLENERKKIWVGLGEFVYDSEDVGEMEIERGFESRKNIL